MDPKVTEGVELSPIQEYMSSFFRSGTLLFHIAYRVYAEYARVYAELYQCYPGVMESGFLEIPLLCSFPRWRLFLYSL